MANVILEEIKDYGFMHSSHTINDVLIKAISFGLSSVESYMESRLLKVSHMFESYTGKAFKDSKVKESPSMGEYCSLVTPIWTPESEITNELISDDGLIKPMKFEFLDISHLYWQTPQGINFIYTLQEKAPLELFALKSM